MREDMFELLIERKYTPKGKERQWGKKTTLDMFTQEIEFLHPFKVIDLWKFFCWLIKTQQKPILVTQSRMHSKLYYLSQYSILVDAIQSS